MENPLGLSFALAVLFLIAAIPVSSAFTGACDGGGCHVTTCYDLQSIKNDTDAGTAGRLYVLDNDIDCSNTSVGGNYLNHGGSGFDPIGMTLDPFGPTYYGLAFNGTFNGNGHTITNLYISRAGTGYVGVFGIVMGANISNVATMDVNVQAFYGASGLVGYANLSSISNCSASGNLTDNNFFSSLYLGGLVAYSDSSNISDSHAVVNVTCDANNNDFGV
jgi:hypothetical protein